MAHMGPTKPSAPFSAVIRVGWFLAVRQIRHASVWTTGLIVAIMTLTFLNLAVVSGILVGLVEGSSVAYRQQYSGDVLVEALDNKRSIENAREIRYALEDDPRVEAVTARILVGVRMEAGWMRLGRSEVADAVGMTLAAIDPTEEDAVTGLAGRMVAGRYLETQDDEGILVGDGILAAYARGAPGDETLDGAGVGDRVRLIVDGREPMEVRVLGVVTSKIGEVNRRAYATEGLARKLTGRADPDPGEIAARLLPGASPEAVVAGLRAAGYGQDAHPQTWQESQGSFFTDISTTFAVLGNVIGAIALAVSSVTVFIVIFIGAVTRRKFIGILKAVGVRPAAIELSYVLLSVFYAVVGTAIGFALLYLVIKPYFDANPIDFPFRDGILVAPLGTTLFRTALLGGATLLAGYLPSRMIVKQRTLDALLNR
jgi:putative ABC transport system permease protein